MGNTPSRFVTKPSLTLGKMGVDLAHVQVAASSGKRTKNVFAGIAAEGFLPAMVLKNYDVVVDYPAHTFTLAQPGSIAHRGVPVLMSVQSKTGFARIEISIADRSYGFMLDTGAASRMLMDEWVGEHPIWLHSVGVAGAANMVGKQFDVTNELLRVPEMQWGKFRLQNTGMVSRPSLAAVLEYPSGKAGEKKRFEIQRGEQKFIVIASALPHP